MIESLKEILACKEQAKMKYPLDIQLFADDPQDPPAEPPKDPEVPKDPPSDPPQQLTQKDIEDAIAKARVKWDAEHEEQQTEAQKLAKMSKEERAEYNLKKKEETFAKREAELNKRELMSTAKETLISKGLPVELAAVLDFTDADTCNKSIADMGKVFQDAVQVAVAARIAGTDPIQKSKLSNTTTLTKEEVEKMTPKQINENWDEIQAMMKNGQLN